MLAVDLGAESGRVIAGRFDGSRLEIEAVRRFPTRSVRLPDGLYWDALGMYDEVLDAFRTAGTGSEVRSVGIDSWAVDFGLLDRAGALTGNPLSYRDGRGSATVDEVLTRVPFPELYTVTGIQLLPINTLFQLRALGELELERAESMLLIPDLLGFWLTGEGGTEATNASTTQLVDARSGDWAWELIDRLEFPRRLFSPIVLPGTVRGGLVPHVAEATGLAASTPVVNVASHDTASAVVAAPLVGDGAAYISSGTWSLVGLEMPQPLLTDDARAVNLTNERGFANTTRLLKNVMGLWLLQECRLAWERQGAAAAYADLVTLASEASSSFLFDPDAPELLTPGEMPRRICAVAGLPDEAEIPVVARAIFESLACKYRLVIDQLAAVTGTSIDTINIIGGGARNEYLCRLTANVTGRRVVAGPVEASALGNLLVQLAAFGDVESLADMRALVASSAVLVEYEPERQRTRWDDLYGRFVELANAPVAAR